VSATGAIDQTALPAAVEAALDAYTSSLRISDIVQAYGGGKEAVKELAHDLAALTTTKDASQVRNINRWLAGESGRGVQTRTPKRSMGNLKQLYLQKNPPKNARIKATGGVVDPSKNRRNRTVDTANGKAPVDAASLIDAVSRGDMWDAYDAMFAGYASGSYMEDASNMEVEFY
jgi:hypothetical protein